jgi:ribonuclease HII
MLKSRYSTTDTKIEVGIDEAGRGCLFGPLIAAAVIWQLESEWDDELREISSQIKDSKKLSAKKRAQLKKAIENYAIDFSIGRVEASEIDQMGMTRANCMAFQRALSGLTVEPDRILIDGILSIDTTKQLIVEPEADNKYIPVAAASILAKETHDEIIKQMCEKEPALQNNYDIASCKGYGTAKHRKGIQDHGIHSHHRKLFLRKLLGLQVDTSQYHFIDE